MLFFSNDEALLVPIIEVCLHDFAAAALLVTD